MATIDVAPDATFTVVNAESSAAIEAGMAVGYDGLKLAQGLEEEFRGISKYEAAAGEPATCQYGHVNAQVTGTGSAEDPLIVSATAGVLEAGSGGVELTIGFALEAWTAADTIRAIIFPSPRRAALT